ncbi:putative glutathione peroxidase 4 [Canna indica]|uniref:Glutathione peroxidase n=1 Tax=Canna indica TaxID=4628 RepID=A0AAQ3JQT5_9LILI|nr:putative glutathione peroxidase 4 [Canna indica]
MGGSQSVPSESSIHEFTVKDGTGKDVDLGIYKGMVLLVVNVASKCGFTNKNYTELTELYTKYKDKDFEILAFPCNQFLGQEPWEEQEIKEFACTRFKAEYPIFQKVKVNGPAASPVFKFLKASKPGFMGNRIKWNFTKFLIDKDGKVIGRYGTSTSPLAIEDTIDTLMRNGEWDLKLLNDMFVEELVKKIEQIYIANKETCDRWVWVINEKEKLNCKTTYVDFLINNLRCINKEVDAQGGIHSYLVGGEECTMIDPQLYLSFQLSRE